MTSLTKNPQPPRKNFFRVQTRRLGVFWDFYRVCIAYWTGEIPTQSHVRLGVVFLRKSPKAAGRQRVNNFTLWELAYKYIVPRFRPKTSSCQLPY